MQVEQAKQVTVIKLEQQLTISAYHSDHLGCKVDGRPHVRVDGKKKEPASDAPPHSQMRQLQYIIQAMPQARCRTGRISTSQVSVYARKHASHLYMLLNTSSD